MRELGGKNAMAAGMAMLRLSISLTSFQWHKSEEGRPRLKPSLPELFPSFFNHVHFVSYFAAMVPSRAAFGRSNLSSLNVLINASIRRRPIVAHLSSFSTTVILRSHLNAHSAARHFLSRSHLNPRVQSATMATARAPDPKTISEVAHQEGGTTKDSESAKL